MKVQIALPRIKERTLLQIPQTSGAKTILRTTLCQYIKYQEQMEKFLVKEIGLNTNFSTKQTYKSPKPPVPGGLSSQLIYQGLKGGNNINLT